METPVLVPISPSATSLRLSPRVVWLIAGTAALALYAATVAPDALMMDYGDYQKSAWLFPHVEPPQGLGSLVRVHINYLMAAKLFGMLVPLGQWAVRVNLFSAVAASIAVANASVLAFAMTRSKPAAALTWLALALGQTSWQYSVIPHVLPFQAATFSAEILVLYLWTGSSNFRWLLALWAINGLAAGTHIQNGLATPVYLALLLAAWWQGRVHLKHVIICLGIWLAGFAPFLVFCIREWIAHSPSGSVIASMTVGHWGGRMWQMNPRVWLRGLLLIGLNYPTGLALLYIPGVLALRRPGLPKAFRWSYLAILSINLLFAMTYNVPDQQSFFVPTYAAAAPLIGLGAVLLFKNRVSWMVAFVLAVLVVPVYAALPTIVRQPLLASRLPLPKANILPYRDPYEFYLKPWKTGWHNDRRYMEEALGALPQGAIFFCSSTVYDGIRAVQTIESRRADLTLNPPETLLGDNIDVRNGLAPRWRRPVYCWSATEKGVPKTLAQYCQFVARGIIWEVLPPQDTAKFISDAAGHKVPPEQ